jgi:hypothetical protein
MRWSVRIVLATVAAIAAVSPALGHHSHAMFDHTREVSITGTVAAFSYRNPHVYLYVDVRKADGPAVRWAVEMSNIENMRSRGIVQSTFRPGDVVTVKVNPLKDGRPGGNYTSVTAADGRTYD